MTDKDTYQIYGITLVALGIAGIYIMIPKPGWELYHGIIFGYIIGVGIILIFKNWQSNEPKR